MLRPVGRLAAHRGPGELEGFEGLRPRAGRLVQWPRPVQAEAAAL